MKNVMKTAWEIARKGQNKFGGKVSEYLSEAMKIAWAFHKSAGSDEQLLARIKKQMVQMWKENKEVLLPKFGTCTVFVKIGIENKLNFYNLNEQQKTQISNTLTAAGF